MDWDIDYKRSKKSTMNGDWATNTFDTSSHSSLILFTIDKTWNEKSIELTAIHEMFHLVQAKLHILAHARSVTIEQINHETERVVVLLTNIIGKYEKLCP